MVAVKQKAMDLDRRLTQWRRRGVKLNAYDLICFYSANHCEMCGTRFKDDGTRHLDHDHDTGKFRGALCNNCNVGLARLSDQPKIAVDMLRRYIKVINARKKKRGKNDKPGPKSKNIRRSVQADQ